MHSHDQAKLYEGNLHSAFWTEIKRLIEEAGEGEANFRGFVFPDLDISEIDLVCSCDFAGAFFGQASFKSTKFHKAVSFQGADFAMPADFRSTHFKSKAKFQRTIFHDTANFVEAHFEAGNDFNNAEFTAGVFVFAYFAERGEFTWCKFTEAGNFTRATFCKGADFKASTLRHANYTQCSFAGPVDYVGTTFKEFGIWNRCSFLDAAQFRNTAFLPRNENEPNANFILTTFARPELVTFDNVDLSQASFHNTDVSTLRFSATVRWGRTSNGRIVLFDEAATSSYAVEHGYWTEAQGIGEEPAGPQNFASLAQLYQQLKKNYDARLDYWTADAFHFGEMEMQRLNVPTTGPLLRARQWWHRHLSLVALYRWGSSYGNSYQRPMLWLLGLLVFTSLAFPFVGLSHTVGVGPSAQVWNETFASAWHAGSSSSQRMHYLLGAVGHGALTAIDTASFQKNAEYGPLYPWGRVIAIAETLLSSTLAGLIFLAVRRQFRR